MSNFIQTLNGAWQRTNSLLCVGLDPEEPLERVIDFRIDLHTHGGSPRRRLADAGGIVPRPRRKNKGGPAVRVTQPRPS